MNNVKAAFKFFLFVTICLIILPVQYLLLLIHKGKGAYILTQLWHKCVCKIFRVKIRIIGAAYKGGQTIYVSNHISYLDIPVIASILRVSFVAKKDVASWPVFGLLSKLQQTAFISRERKNAKGARQTLDNMLGYGKSLFIFPEGTSTDGREVLPFKSSLFSIAFKENLTELYVQPITLKMDNMNGGAIKTQNDRDLYSWHINMDTPLGEHLWRFAQNNGAEISLHFHDPIKAQTYENRKTLAKACHKAVSSIEL